jgi:hypothetical protein
VSKDAVRMRVKRGMRRSEKGKGEDPPSRALRRAHSAASESLGDNLQREQQHRGGGFPEG